MAVHLIACLMADVEVAGDEEMYDQMLPIAWHCVHAGYAAFYVFDAQRLDAP